MCKRIASLHLHLGNETLPRPSLKKEQTTVRECNIAVASQTRTREEGSWLQTQSLDFCLVCSPPSSKTS